MSEISKATFMTTQWTRILHSQRTPSGTRSDALTLLCQHYHRPLYLFILRHKKNKSDAEDLTQSFFAYLAENKSYRQADRHRGKFRTFLLTSVKNYLLKEHRDRNRQKRGGKLEHVSIDHPDTPSIPDAEAEANDAYFDQEWATSTFDSVWSLLNDEYRQSGHARRFELLRTTLATPDQAIPYHELAKELDLTENGVKSAVFRLRGRFRDLFRATIAQVVENPAEVDEETRYLMEILIRNPRNPGNQTG